MRHTFSAPSSPGPISTACLISRSSKFATIRLPDGRVVRAEIAARLYMMTGRMIGARYPIED
jgi:hypothetical protein